jgi:hypothetical protein
MRAALNAYRIPMMELLVSHGADVNALWHGHFPIIFDTCESLDPAALKWLLDHGACLVSKIHAVELHDLTDAAGTAFMRDARRVSAALAASTGAVKLNYEIQETLCLICTCTSSQIYRG